MRNGNIFEKMLLSYSVAVTIAAAALYERTTLRSTLPSGETLPTSEHPTEPVARDGISPPCIAGSATGDALHPATPSAAPQSLKGILHPEEVEPSFVAYRIARIEKLLPITEEQRQRLQRKFQLERLLELRHEGNSPSAEEQAGIESLAQILGDDGAKKAEAIEEVDIDRSQRFDAEKNAIYLASELKLSPEIEKGLADLLAKHDFEAVELAALRRRLTLTEDQAEKARQIIHSLFAPDAESQQSEPETGELGYWERAKDRFREILTPGQYDDFLAYAAESAG